MLCGLEEAKKQLLQELLRQTTGGEAPASFPVVVRVKVPLVDIDPLSWLAGQKADSKVFWHSVDGGMAVAGIGIAFEVSAQGWYGFDEAWNRVSEFMQACPEARLFSGMSFARTMSAAEWAGFPALQFILPAVEVIKDKQGCWLIANAVRGRDGEPFNRAAGKALEKMYFAEQVTRQEVSVIAREDIPDYEDWACSAEGVSESLEKEEVEKVVLARRVTLDMEGAFSPEMVLRSVMGQQKSDFAYLFCVKGNSFFGTSSELLYLRQGSRVRSRAVAGGRPRGKDRVEDDRLKEVLLRSDKDQREHRLVAGALVEVFREFCRSYQVDCQQEVFRSAVSQRLLMRLSGILSEGVTDKEFLQALHPAPVVCGVPAEKARLLLQQYEVFERGWFCGPVGFFSQGRAEVAIASRACLMEGGNFHVYATAAFVKGADAFSRWEAAAGEMKNILNVVQGALI